MLVHPLPYYRGDKNTPPLEILTDLEKIKPHHTFSGNRFWKKIPPIDLQNIDKFWTPGSFSVSQYIQYTNAKLNKMRTEGAPGIFGGILNGIEQQMRAGFVWAYQSKNAPKPTLL